LVNECAGYDGAMVIILGCCGKLAATLIFMERIEYGLYEAPQKPRQFERVKFHADPLLKNLWSVWHNKKGYMRTTHV